MVRTLFTAAAGVLLFVWVLFIGPLCWVLKDGLGPNAVDSDGWPAVTRLFWTFYWGPVALVLAALTAAGALWVVTARPNRGPPHDGGADAA